MVPSLRMNDKNGGDDALAEMDIGISSIVLHQEYPFNLFPVHRSLSAFNVGSSSSYPFLMMIGHRRRERCFRQSGVLEKLWHFAAISLEPWVLSWCSGMIFVELTEEYPMHSSSSPSLSWRAVGNEQIETMTFCRKIKQSWRMHTNRRIRTQTA